MFYTGFWRFSGFRRRRMSGARHFRNGGAFVRRSRSTRLLLSFRAEFIQRVIVGFAR
jgi:hypothetical protein